VPVCLQSSPFSNFSSSSITNLPHPGGGILANAKKLSTQKLGNNIIIAGLGIQVVFFGLFMITTVIFHVRIARKPTARSYSVTAPWKQFLWALYFTSALIMVRSIFRMVEYAMGKQGVLMQHEIYVLVLDAALMFIVAVAFVWPYHPSRILSGYKDVAKGGSGAERGSSSDGGESRAGLNGYRMGAVGGPDGGVVVPGERYGDASPERGGWR